MNKVFNIGFNKSGTTSLTRACEVLGFRSLHWLYEDRRLCDVIEEEKSRNRRFFESLEDYNFFSDFNGKYYFRELDEQYPGSKFILTIRDLEGWLDSREKHVIRNQRDPDYKHDWLTVDRKAWAEDYWRYQAELDAYFKDRSGDSLIMNIAGGDGWDTLAPFLGKEIPTVPFPVENRAASFENIT
ncbi:MAG: sulfotransferase [bacterium]